MVFCVQRLCGFCVCVCVFSMILVYGFLDPSCNTVVSLPTSVVNREREGKVLWTLGFIEVSSNEVEIVGHALCLVLGRLPWV